jgi:hypothetical protein
MYARRAQWKWSRSLWPKREVPLFPPCSCKVLAFFVSAGCAARLASCVGNSGLERSRETRTSWDAAPLCARSWLGQLPLAWSHLTRSTRPVLGSTRRLSSPPSCRCSARRCRHGAVENRAARHAAHRPSAATVWRSRARDHFAERAAAARRPRAAGHAAGEAPMLAALPSRSRAPAIGTPYGHVHREPQVRRRVAAARRSRSRYRRARRAVPFWTRSIDQLILTSI